MATPLAPLNGPAAFNELIAKFNAIFDAGLGLLRADTISLFSILVLIEITICALYWTMSGSDFAGKFIKKNSYYRFFKYIIDNYGTLTSVLVAGSAKIGGVAAGWPTFSADNPSQIMAEGISLIKVIFAYANSQSLFGQLVKYLSRCSRC